MIDRKGGIPPFLYFYAQGKLDPPYSIDNKKPVQRIAWLPDFT